MSGISSFHYDFIDFIIELRGLPYQQQIYLASDTWNCCQYHDNQYHQSTKEQSFQKCVLKLIPVSSATSMQYCPFKIPKCRISESLHDVKYFGGWPHAGRVVKQIDPLLIKTQTSSFVSFKESGDLLRVASNLNSENKFHTTAFHKHFKNLIQHILITSSF